MEFHNIQVTVKVRVPHVIDDVRFGHKLPSATHEVLEHSELPAGQVNLHLPTTTPPRRLVDDEVGVDQQHRTLRGSAPEQRSEVRDQHKKRERFRQIVVRPEIERLELSVASARSY